MVVVVVMNVEGLLTYEDHEKFVFDAYQTLELARQYQTPAPQHPPPSRVLMWIQLSAAYASCPDAFALRLQVMYSELEAERISEREGIEQVYCVARLVASQLSTHDRDEMVLQIIGACLGYGG